MQAGGRGRGRSRGRAKAATEEAAAEAARPGPSVESEAQVIDDDDAGWYLLINVKNRGLYTS